MRKILTTLALVAATAGTVLAAGEQQAAACGGCFVPTENNTIVTDHRMVLSIGRGESTLYDQIRYTGDPKEFAWVLPISGTAKIGLSADTVFAALDQLTQVQVQAPTPQCQCNNRAPQASADGAGSSSGGSSGGVQILKEEVVGPYATVQLRSTDPNALTDWLTTNKFAIPDDIKPVIAQYVGEKFDFLAIKLIPGATVKSMRPVRVTTTGTSAVLPLRMVAAGTGATVGITLWITGEGRYEPQNFPSFVIKSDELVWDWTANKSNYKDLRAEKAAALGGAGWEVETSTSANLSTIENIVRFGGNNGGASSGAIDDDGGYLPETTNGVITKTASQVREEDLAALFGGVASARVTRIRADLARAALGKDLLVTASADQSQIPNLRQAAKSTGTPNCPPGCTPVETPDNPTGSSGGATGPKESFSCTTSTNGVGGVEWLAAVGAMLGLVAAKASRRRKSS